MGLKAPLGAPLCPETHPVFGSRLHPMQTQTACVTANAEHHPKWHLLGMLLSCEDC